MKKSEEPQEKYAIKVPIKCYIINVQILQQYKNIRLYNIHIISWNTYSSYKVRMR